jgi:hypothetical protein
MNRLLLALATLALAHAAGAQSIGTMTSPETGAAAAGGGPVGALLPSSIQSSSTAPILPGHTITGDRPNRQPQRMGATEPQQEQRVSQAQPPK